MTGEASGMTAPEMLALVWQTSVGTALILRVPVLAGGAVFPELVEMVAVQVDAVREGGVVAHDDPGRLAARKPAPRPFRKPEVLSGRSSPVI